MCQAVRYRYEGRELAIPSHALSPPCRYCVATAAPPPISGHRP